MPIREEREIQRAHDILVAVMIGDVPIRLDDDASLHASLDSLCWVLGHTHNDAFARNLAAIESAAAEAGMKLFDSGELKTRD